MTLLIALLVFTSPFCPSNQQDEIDFDLPIISKNSVYNNSNGNYKHLKFLHSRIPYNVKSTAAFQIELLKSMDVNPNQGPTAARTSCKTSPSHIPIDISSPRYVYSAASLISMNPYRYDSDLPKLSTVTWNTIKTLKIINRIPINYRTKRRGRRKPWKKNGPLHSQNQGCT